MTVLFKKLLQPQKKESTGVEKVSEADLVKRVKAFILNDNYAGALAVVKGVDASRIKNPPILCLIGEVYMHEKQYEVAEEVFLRAYERSPKNRKILDLITSLYIEMGEYAEAEYYYKEFISVASRDLHRYILRYRLDKGKGERLSVLIDTLERLKDYEYIEEWAYELATLYEAAGEEKKCIHECDEIVLWFGHGEYVDKAIALKCKLTGEPLPKMTTVEMEMENNLRAEREARTAEDENEAAMTRRARTDSRNPKPSSTEFSDVDDVRVIDPDNALESAGVDTGIDTEMIQKAMESERASMARESSSMSNTGLLFGAMSGDGTTSEGLTEANLDDEDADNDGSDHDGSDHDGSDRGGSDHDESDYDGSDRGGSDHDGLDNDGLDHDGSDNGDSDHNESSRTEGTEVPVKKNSAEEDKEQSGKLMKDLFKTPGLDKVKRTQRPQMPEFLKKDAQELAQDSMDELEALLAGLPDADMSEEELDDDDEIISQDSAYTDELMSMFAESRDAAAGDDFSEVKDTAAGDDFSEIRDTAGDNDFSESIDAAADENVQDRSADDTSDYDKIQEDRTEKTETAEDDFEMFGDPAYVQPEVAQNPDMGSVNPDMKPADTPAADASEGSENEIHSDEDDGIEVEEALESMTEDQDEVLLEQAVFGGLPSGEMLEDDLDAEDEYMDDEQVQVQISEEDEQFLAELFSTGGPDAEDTDAVSDKDAAITQTVKSIFATVPDVKNVHQQLAMTLSKFETTGTDYDVLAPYDINFVVLSDDKGMKSQIALGIAKALNTYGICDKNKIVRAKASELNRQDFSIIFGKISGGCLIIERADELSDASVAIIENVVNQENQDVAIVFESRQDELKAFWKKHKELRGKFLNVINVSKYNEMELVTLAKGYIEKRGYELSPEAAIVLRDFFKKKNQKDQVFGYEDVMTVVDDGIANLDKRNMKNLFMTVLDNKYEEADMLKLLPEDFKGVL